LLRRNAHSDILPRKSRNILPSRVRDILPRAGDSLPLPGRVRWLPTTGKRGSAMTSRRTTKASSHITEARAVAQRAKLDAQARQRQSASTTPAQTPKSSRNRKAQEDLLSRRRAATTVERAIIDFLDDHEGGNHSAKTLEWHRTALGLFRGFLLQERSITLVGEIDAPDISAWFAFMRKTPTGRGGTRSERTIQTYARSVRAFFHWLVRRETIERNPFDRVVFPKVGKPLIRTISPEEFERLLLACTPPNESGPIAHAMRNELVEEPIVDP
jgi:integrase/recombinase XerD